MRKTLRPTRTEAPGCTSPSRTFTLSTKVPFVLPQSLTVMPPG